MAKGIFKVKAKAKGGSTDVKMMAKHDMESGLAKDKNGQLIPANYLNTVKVTHGGKVVFEANLGPSISKNPYLGFSFKGGAKGDELVVAWTEITGKSGEETNKVR